jgi:ABC-type amino acid transport substrate-binding protein
MAVRVAPRRASPAARARRWRRACAALAGLLALAAAGAAGGAETRPPLLTACVVEDNPPFSTAGAQGRGLDADFARLLAARLGREPGVQPVRVPSRGGLGKALKLSVASGTCDIFLGVPAGAQMTAELAEHQLVASRPYLGLAYLLVSPAGSRPATLAEARHARRVGVATATPADLFLFKDHYPRVPYGNNADLLAALARGEIELALAWSPAIAALHARQPPVEVVLAAEQPDDPDLRAGLAIALRASDPELARAIDAAIAQLQADGSMARLAGQYGLPMAPAP